MVLATTIRPWRCSCQWRRCSPTAPWSRRCTSLQTAIFFFVLLLMRGFMAASLQGNFRSTCWQCWMVHTDTEPRKPGSSFFRSLAVAAGDFSTVLSIACTAVLPVFLGLPEPGFLAGSWSSRWLRYCLTTLSMDLMETPVVSKMAQVFGFLLPQSHHLQLLCSGHSFLSYGLWITRDLRKCSRPDTDATKTFRGSNNSFLWGGGIM